MLICYAACVLLAIFTVIYLWYLNKLNHKRRVARGKGLTNCKREIVHY